MSADKTRIADDHKLIVGALEDLLGERIYSIKARPLTDGTGGKMAYEFGIKANGVWHMKAILSFQSADNQMQVRLTRKPDRVTGYGAGSIDFEVNCKNGVPQDEILTKLICGYR